jgi:hypothetical protein
LWSFHHTFTLTCVRPLVIVGWNAIDVHLSRIGLPSCRSSHKIGQFLPEAELHRVFR